MGERNYGIDLLKIIAMFGVISLHVLYKLRGDMLGNFILILFSCSVNVFAMISGYTYYNKEHHYRNILSLLFIALFYNLIISFIYKFMFSDILMISKHEYFSYLFPPINDRHWYLTSYLLLFLLIPVLNSFLTNNQAKYVRNILVILGLALSFSSISLIKDIFYIRNGYSTLWLIYCYLIGGYIKKANVFVRHKFVLVVVFVLSCMCIFLSRFLISEIFGFESMKNIFMQYISPFILLNSILYVLLFKDINVCEKKLQSIICFFSLSTFDVYIIHAHPFLLDKFIYTKFNFIYDGNIAIVFLKGFLCCLSIFLSCSIIYLIRKYIFKLLRIVSLTNNLGNRIDSFIAMGK